jgi:hypothetical protein
MFPIELLIQPFGRISALLGPHQWCSASRSRCAFDLEQLRDAQNAFDSSLAGTPSSLSRALYFRRPFLAKSGGTLMRGAHRMGHSPERPPRSTWEPQGAIRRYIEVTNHRPKPFVWTKTTDEIIASVSRFCKPTSDSGH